MNTQERILTRIGSEFESDAAFERAASLPPRTVNDWRRGKSQAYMKMLPRLAGLLGTTSSYLLCETDDPTPPGEKKEPATVSDGGLDGNEQKLIDLFRQVPDESRGLVLGMIEAALKSQGLL